MPMSIQDKEAEALSDKSKTITFTVRDEKEEEMKRTLAAIYEQPHQPDRRLYPL